MTDIDLDALYERTRDAMDVYEDDESTELDELFPDDSRSCRAQVGL